MPPALTATIVQQEASPFGGNSWVKVKAVDPDGLEVPGTVSINGATGATEQNISFKNDCALDIIFVKENIPCRGTVSAAGYSPGSFTAGVLSSK
jgi:hypothetical protein